MRNGLKNYGPAEHKLNKQLISACAQGSFKACARYISQGADVNYQEAITGNTPAHYAAAYNQVDIFNYLSAKGGLKAQKNANAYTYLHMAAAFGSIDMVIHLVEKNICDIAARTSQGKTAPQLAADKNSKAKIAALGEEKERPRHIRAPSISSQSSIQAARMGLYVIPRSIKELLNLLAEPENIIRRLDFGKCPDITDTWMQYIAPQLTELNSLVLFQCNKITDAGILPIIIHMPNIVLLNLCSCPQITDAALSYIAGLDKMEHLYIRGCDSITDKGINHIIVNAGTLSRLWHIDMYKCKSIKDDATLIQLGQVFPQADITDPTGKKITQEQIQKPEISFVRKAGAKNGYCIIL